MNVDAFKRSAKSGSMSYGWLDATVIGDKEIHAKLSRLGWTAQTNLLKSAVVPSLKKMQNSAQRNIRSISVHKPTKKVRRSIASNIQIKTTNKRGLVVGRLAVWYSASRRASEGVVSEASLSHLFEFGFRLTHYFGRKIAPKLIPAKPFMTPAFQSNKSNAEQAFVRAITTAVQEIAT